MIWLILSYIALYGPVVQSQTIDQTIERALTSSMAADFIQDNTTVLVELDMKFKASVWREIQEENARFESGENRDKRKATNYLSQRWTNNIVYYTIAPRTFDSTAMNQISAAITDWEYYTCIDFRQRTSQRNYIYIQNGAGCSSYVGMIGGSQPVNLAPGCRYKGVIIHELGHAIGFQHEQTRPDRNSHVEILFQNIQSGVEYNFQRYSNKVVNDYGVPYDYESIMHYGQFAFSRNNLRTIRTFDQSKQNVIGNRNGLSFRDIKLANLMYKCNSHCGNIKCPGEGFLSKNCKCWCPGNPIKLCEGEEGGTGGGGGENDCEDENNNCASWAANEECKANPDWMLEHCKKSCKVCEDEEEEGGGGEGTDCRDSNDNCQTWEQSGYCNSILYRNYMTEHCRKSCNRCISEGCEDISPHCSSWKQSGYCQYPIYREYMKVNCKSSCDYCTSGDASNCSDGDGNCSYWASIGECDKNPAYMHVNCQKSCKKC